jgi:hypothetical protein
VFVFVFTCLVGYVFVDRIGIWMWEYQGTR